jgi:7-carboxy-7-deazaguanine synthase
MDFKVNTIYPSFMGEVNTYGIGVACTFVRLAGCNLRCYLDTMGTLCDTPESLEKHQGDSLTLNEIIDKLEDYGNDVICLTGGEPLMFRPTELLQRLSNLGFKVVVETNGSMDVSPYRDLENVSFVVDYKLASTGEGGSFLNKNVGILNDKDFIKFVVNSEEDLEEAFTLIESIPNKRVNIALGLYWGSKISTVDFLKTLRERKFTGYVNMQTHKFMMLQDKAKDIIKEMTIPKNL